MSSNYFSGLKKDILTVDDSPCNLRVLSTTLIKSEYTVRCVKSALMALIGVLLGVVITKFCNSFKRFLQCIYHLPKHWRNRLIIFQFHQIVNIVEGM
ncbi:hypothetical protein OsccyDRAFT_4732 [Leptolyngbyaceae cyanobacterium JSC-12]|nr:hypothetical protein OsccyDRAFT_4732 [Leptolyngbyaceae cyanobacterium JSC-12]